MPKIHVMPEILASQVAAGEVVERPASVVKELVENSIDAGATRVDVLIRRGGTALIRVVDDGSGMGREDAVLCLERHATSKIRTSSDLAAIRTMGFRGEALPSIASVSRFVLRTREREALSGTEVIVEGGATVGVHDAGDAPGTHIEVRSLFYNVPARRKFLRAEATEFSHIEHQVRVHALAHPEIAFTLTHDERLVLQLPAGSSLRERIGGLAGPEIVERLREVPLTSRRGIAVHGFLGEPGLHRSNRALLHTFLNRRPVESPVFIHALRGAFAEALPRGTWPVAFLFIELDPAEVDVNVHPAKREVRFRGGTGVQSVLMEIFTEVLRGRPEAMPAVDPAPATSPVLAWRAPQEQPALIPETEQRALRRDWSSLPTPPAVTPTVTPPAPVPDPDIPPSRDSSGPPEAPPFPDKLDAAPPPDATRPAFRIIGRLGEAYWLMESNEGLVVLDCRAARERILYEETRNRRRAEPLPSQSLLTPLTVQLSPREFDFLRPHLGTLRTMGIGAAEFGGNTLVIDSLPPFHAADGDTAALVSRLIADLRHAGERAPQRRLDDDAIAAAVARQAARAPVPESPDGARALTAELMACEMPYCCPEGRPTLIQISFHELARKFGRR